MGGEAFIRDASPIGPTINAAGMALIFGVPEAELTQAIQRPGDADGTTYAVRFPEEWLRNGRRRYREAAAACGSDLITDVLEHLRRQS